MPKRNISFIKPPEPKFLKKLKEQMGYQEPDTVETKKQILPKNMENQTELDDEKPVIVALKPGDLTEEDFEKEMASTEDPNKKIVFNRPVKKDADESNPLVCSSKQNNDDLKKRVRQRNENVKQVKNSSLLSFDEDENEDDE